MREWAVGAILLGTAACSGDQTTNGAPADAGSDATEIGIGSPPPLRDASMDAQGAGGTSPIRPADARATPFREAGVPPAESGAPTVDAGWRPDGADGTDAAGSVLQQPPPGGGTFAIAGTLTEFDRVRCSLAGGDFVAVTSDPASGVVGFMLETDSWVADGQTYITGANGSVALTSGGQTWRSDPGQEISVVDVPGGWLGLRAEGHWMARSLADGGRADPVTASLALDCLPEYTQTTDVAGWSCTDQAGVEECEVVDGRIRTSLSPGCIAGLYVFATLGSIPGTSDGGPTSYAVVPSTTTPAPGEASAYYLGGSLLFDSTSSGTIEAYVDRRGVVNITVTDVGVGEESAIQFLDAQLACRLP